ncbi:LPXTG-motif cell wall anchor domain-containing protein [Actinacidiphila yanglinensis]|uniref:LPXTG-motif cell wall anchor domain-containing protein n=1 Tax=Actinacidiphila yanglinensis TaxID=310779 RepID=A0A1H6A1K6_9ACTN|nr:LAETG motif-containing sortase-dependent surface protein [Actinacidiphila yanglinensis]SEG42321.1 LPXTG-motif cell wall anchor domain-containing protein [Actinacidiphila yanglinensis]
MKLRRAVVSVAATAALAPVALFAATSASAAAGDTPSPTASATSTVTTTPSATPTTDAPTAAPTTDAPTTPATPTTSPATTPATPTTGATTPPDDGTACDDSSDEPQVDKNLTTTISGLPGKVAAGSGWHPFGLAVKNSSAKDYKRVDFALFAATVSAKDWNEDTSHLKVQFQNPDTGKWVAISLDENDPDANYLGYTEVKGHDSFTLKLRLNVDAKAPAGEGYVFGAGVYADDQGQCAISGGDNFYTFDVLAAGSASGGGAVPTTGGEKPLPAKPAGDTELATGNLAETGSSSALPTIAGVGGAVVVLGAGAVFLVRRRKTGTPGGLAG